jgi:hypothetical protein
MIKTYLINTQKAIGETLEGEAIIINLETGSYYSMNPAGTALWNAISNRQPITLDAPGVLDFINLLVTEELILEDTRESPAPAVTITELPTLEKYDDMQEMLLADPIHDVDTAGWPKLKE